jgi:histidine triad (HIT) family protein
MSSGDWKEMFHAAVDGDMDLLRYHLSAQVDPNYQHPEYMCTPLVACILAGQYDAAALLLQWGADPKLRSESEGMTPLQAAHQRRDPALIRLIDPLTDGRASCIFCQILANQVPASKVHEDDFCLAFMDLYPLARGHVLVIPKTHKVQLTELSAQETQRLFKIGNRILHAQRALGWGVQGSHFLLNDGPAANQLVPHVHLHIIPREPKDTIRTLGKLALHLTGIMGLPHKREALNAQATQLRHALSQIHG